MKSLEQRRIEATPKGISIICNWFVERAENASLWDVNGKEFIDFASGISVLNVGHRHPRVVAAIEAQLKKFTHSSYQLTPYECYIELAERLNEIIPINGGGKKKTCFFNSGGEATENAIKIAKAKTKRFGIISFGGSFHGRTATAVGMTGKVVPYKAQLGIGMVGIYHALFPNKLHKITTQDALKSLEQICKYSISPLDVAAIVFEPVQGEGGFNPANEEFIAGLRAFCDEHGIVLIADEVQTGFGRTGKMFAMEHFDTQADIICTAKSLGGGLPISGITGRAEIMDSVEPGGMGGTYAGNPLAVVAGLEVLKIIEDENLIDRSNKLGNKLQKTLKALKHKEIAQVRGLGSMVAIEFYKNDCPHKGADIAKSVQKIAMDKGLLLLTCGMYGNVIRFLYPLTIPDNQFDKALEILKSVIDEVVG